MYADYYERALTNGVLGIQRGSEPGVMIYMLPQGRGKSKGKSYHGWGTKFDSFWCCYGTGVSISPNLLIIFFPNISWDEKGKLLYLGVLIDLHGKELHSYVLFYMGTFFRGKQNVRGYMAFGFVEKRRILLKISCTMKIDSLKI